MIVVPDCRCCKIGCFEFSESDCSFTLCEETSYLQDVEDRVCRYKEHHGSVCPNCHTRNTIRCLSRILKVAWKRAGIELEESIRGGL